MECRRVLLCMLAVNVASLALCMRVQVAEPQGDVGVQMPTSQMLNDLQRDRAHTTHIICPVLNAFVQNGDMKTFGGNVDADTVMTALMRAGLNQPKYSGEPLPTGITQSSAFEYTFGVFLKNKAGNYRDDNGTLTLPIYNLDKTLHEHNSHTGITTNHEIPFDNAQWELLAAQADRELPNMKKCFSRDAWAHAMRSFEMRAYDGTPIDKIDRSVIREDHTILQKNGKGILGYVVGKVLNKGAKNGNDVLGKRLVAGVSQVMNGMINLFWTGDYGNLDLYQARARQAESEEAKAGLSFPWLDEDFCLPVDELKAVLIGGTYPDGYGVMTSETYKAKGKVWKFPKSRCTAAYFQREGKGYEPLNDCIDGEPPLIDAVGWAQRTALKLLSKT